VIRARIHPFGLRFCPVFARYATADKLLRPRQTSLRIAFNGADQVDCVAINPAHEAGHFEPVAIVSQSQRGALAAVYRARRAHLVSPSRHDAQPEQPRHFARIG
jgi:hypothetical protein